MKTFNIFGYEIVIKKQAENKLQDIDVEYYKSIPSLTYAITLKAHEETVNYITQNIDLSSIMLCDNRFRNLSYCLLQAKKIQGLYLEFGVHTGRSLNYIAKRIGKKIIYGFDSFEGLPNNWNGFSMFAGNFNLKGCIPAKEKNVRLYKGWFDSTLPMFLKHNQEKVAFLHIDSDLYESAKVILENLATRFQEGSIIVFDEYFNYPNWQKHEFRAFKEFVEKFNVNYKYISFGKLQVGIQIISIGE